MTSSTFAHHELDIPRTTEGSALAYMKSPERVMNIYVKQASPTQPIDTESENYKNMLEVLQGLAEANRAFFSGVPILPALTEPYQEIVEIIQSFYELGPDWDSYGAEPISEKAIKRAISLTTQCQQLQIFLDFAAPMSDGGIQLEGKDSHKDIFLEIEIPPEETCTFLIFDANRQSLRVKGHLAASDLSLKHLKHVIDEL